MPARRQPQREQQAAGEGADAVDAGEQTDAFGAKQQPVSPITGIILVKGQAKTL